MSEELQEVINSNPEWYKELLLPDVKEFIKSNMASASRSFVAIGYYLKYIRDHQLFTEDSYQSIWEFAKGEFGIGKSSASQFMSINDKFSKDGNSPILQEQYKDFSSSKLAEMLTLSDEQLEKIEPTTTIVEIRQIKKPVEPIVETVLTSEQEQLPSLAEINDYPEVIPTKTNIFEEAAKQIYIPEVDKRILTDVAKWCIEKLKDTLQLQIEVNGFAASMEKLLIMNLQTNAIRPVNNYSIFFSKTYVKVTDHEFDKTENLLYLDIDQEIHRIWFDEVGVDKVPEIESDVDETEDEEDITEFIDNTPEYKEIVSEIAEIVINEVEIVSEPVETVEADIIQTVPEDNDDGEPEEITDPEKYSWFDVDCELDTLMKYLEEFRKTNIEVPGRRKSKMRWDAMVLLNNEMRKPKVIEEEKELKQTQPELPVLKNNDQRKDFIDAYETWPIWIDQKETGERYYRYNITDKAAIIVKVSRKHMRQNYKETKEYEYGAEQYYLLGVNYEWSTKGAVFREDDTRTFFECNTNKTALIDYLKDLQKK